MLWVVPMIWVFRMVAIPITIPVTITIAVPIAIPVAVPIAIRGAAFALLVELATALIGLPAVSALVKRFEIGDQLPTPLFG